MCLLVEDTSGKNRPIGTEAVKKHSQQSKEEKLQSVWCEQGKYSQELPDSVVQARSYQVLMCDIKWSCVFFHPLLSHIKHRQPRRSRLNAIRPWDFRWPLRCKVPKWTFEVQQLLSSLITWELKYNEFCRPQLVLSFTIKAIILVSICKSCRYSAGWWSNKCV